MELFDVFFTYLELHESCQISKSFLTYAGIVSFWRSVIQLTF